MEARTNIIIIVIITGKSALFESYPFLEGSSRLYPVFTSLDFATVIFLQSKVVSLASNYQPRGPGHGNYVPQ
jgi:hypothetical protein